MKYLIFNDDVSKESITNLISQITEENDDVTIYFVSGGGDVTFSEVFIDFTFRYPKEITLVCNFQVASCAFDILFKSKTKKEIKNGCFGLIHLQTIEGTLREFDHPQEETTKFFKKDLDRSNRENYKFYKKIGITEPELKNFLDGRDVIIDTKEMKVIAKNAENIFFSGKKLSKKEKEAIATSLIEKSLEKDLGEEDES